MNSDKYDLIDLLNFVAINKIRIFTISFIASFITAIIVLIVPEYWKSEADIIPLASEKSSLNLNLDLLDNLGGGLNSGEETAAVNLISAMYSSEFTERVINQFDLYKILQIDEDDIDKKREITLKIVREEIVKIVYNKDTNIITVSVVTKDKKLSKSIVQFYLDHIDEFMLNLNKAKNKPYRLFLENRIVTLKTEADSLANQLIIFQKKHKTISLDNQVKSSIEIYSDLMAKSIAKDIEIETSEQFMDKSSDFVDKLLKEKKVLSDNLKKLESDRSFSDLLIPMNEIPQLSKEYTKLYLDVEIKTKVYSFLYPQYESAKLEEMKDLPSFYILNAANSPGIRLKPKRTLTVLLVFIAFFFISSYYYVLKNTVKSEYKGKLLVLFKNIFRLKNVKNI